MAIHKGESARKVMIAARSVQKPVAFHGHRESSLVDAIRVFINEHKQQGRRGPDNAGYFTVGNIFLASDVVVSAIQPRSVYRLRAAPRVWISPYSLAHGKSSGCRNDGSAIGRGRGF